MRIQIFKYTILKKPRCMLLYSWNPDLSWPSIKRCRSEFLRVQIFERKKPRCMLRYSWNLDLLQPSVKDLHDHVKLFHEITINADQGNLQSPCRLGNVHVPVFNLVHVQFAIYHQKFGPFLRSAAYQNNHNGMLILYRIHVCLSSMKFRSAFPGGNIIYDKTDSIGYEL